MNFFSTASSFSKQLLAAFLALVLALLAGWYFSTQATQAAFYGSGNWDYRQKITIDSAQVNANLTDFPVYVDLSDMSSGFFNNVQTDGADIRVTTTDGTTELAREVVSIDTGTNTGELHFQADSLSATSDTEFYIYYGNSSATNYAESDTFGAQNVWTNGFEAVWHMQEDPSGTVLDSTANNNDGNSAGLGSDGSVAGRLSGNAIDFDGTDDNLNTGNADVVGDITVSLWARQDTLPAGGSVQFPAAVEFDGSVTAWEMKTPGPTGGGTGTNFRFQSYDNGSAQGVAVDQANFSANTWYHLAGTCGAGQWALYKDGADLGGTTYNQGTCALASSQDRNIGSQDGANHFYDGTIDEVRLSATERSADWVASEYANQNTPTTFYTVGAQETETEPGTTFGDNPSGDFGDTDWTYRQEITIQSSEVDTNLTDFSVYVDLADLGSSFFSNVNTDGSDIRITAGNGTTELAREIVSIDTASSTGEVHFKADSLSASQDTSFYIYYGNSSATNYGESETYGAQNVWTTFEAVWHMAEDPSGSAPQISDVTGNGYDLTTNGSMQSADLIDGQVGQAIEFDGVDDYMIATGLSFPLEDWTLTEMVNIRGYDAQYEGIVSIAPTGGTDWDDGIQHITDGSPDVVQFWYGIGDDLRLTPDINSLEYMAGRYDQSTQELRGWVNGVKSADIASGAPQTQTQNVIVVGEGYNGSVSGGSVSPNDLIMDELRLALTPLSDGWITAESSNQNTPTTFYSVGAQETESGGSAGDLDLIVGNDNQPNRVYKNDGTGSFALFDSTAEDDRGSHIVTGDIDGDGDTDYIDGDSSFGAAIRVYKNDGTGSFALSESIAEDDNISEIALGDLDDDGDLDFIAVLDDDGLAHRFYKNDGTGFFTLDSTFGPGEDTLSVALGDVDGDNDLDVIVGDDRASIKVYTNNGAGSFTFKEDTAETEDTQSIAIGDIDSDDDLDFIAGNTSTTNGTRVYENDGTGSFTLSERSNEVDDTLSIALGDVDGDSDLDYVAGNNNDPNRIYINDGTGSFTLAESSVEDDSTLSIALGDIDDDGDLDYVAGNDGQSNRVYTNDGTGSFTLAESSTESDDTHSVALANIDNDGQVNEAPSVTTNPVSNIATSSATGNGEITDTGGEDADERGFVYSTASQSDPGNTAPGSSGYSDSTTETGSFGVGTFSDSLTNLSADTTYYVRAFAHNSAGYSYGGEVSFTTNASGGGSNDFLYVGDHATRNIYKYTLSANGDISTATYSGDSLDLSARTGSLEGLAFNGDGTTLYFVDFFNDEIEESTLATGFDLSTASSNGAAAAVGSEAGTPQGIFLNVADSNLYVVNYDDAVYAYDLPAGTYTGNSLNVQGGAISAQFGADGSKLFVSSYFDEEVYQYSLSTPYDITTATYDNVSFDVSSEDATNAGHITFNTDGTRLYLSDYDEGFVYQYNLSTGFDLSTASYSGNSLDTSSQGTKPSGLFYVSSTDIGGSAGGGTIQINSGEFRGGVEFR